MTIASFALPELVRASQSATGSGAPLLQEFDAALIDPGGFRLTDLPVAADLVEKMRAVTQEFFELPIEIKARYRYVEDQYVGWCGGDFLTEYGSIDQKEMFHIGPRVAPTLRAHGTDRGIPDLDAELLDAAPGSSPLWPTAPQEFIALWHEYYLGMQATAADLGMVLATTLGMDIEEWFEVLGDNWADLAANYYPPLPPYEGDTPPVYNVPHCDLTVFTILFQDQNRTGGLSMQSADGTWEDVEPIAGSFVVNVGELLTYLSGGRWRAAPHQVTVNPTADGRGEARISIPFFYRPSDLKTVTSFVDPDAAPIAVGDWVIERKRGPAAKAS